MTKREITAQVMERFTQRRAEGEREYDERIAALSDSVPGFAELTRELNAVGLSIFASSVGKGGENIDEIKSRTKELRAKRCALLESAGYPADYADRRYNCEKCADSGYVGLKMCSCLRKEFILAETENSGLGKLLKTQSFDNFSLRFYSGRDETMMKHNLDRLRAFAENFTSESSESFLLLGATGLGKTHLSTSVAKVVLDRGYNVVYRTAQDIMSVFERQRFGDGHQGDGTEREFFEAELLIIDDLGTEVVTQYTVSWLYDIINSRTNEDMPTIINTNLTKEELRSRYADRITSRIFGEFLPLVFSGRDVRLQKLSI